MKPKIYLTAFFCFFFMSTIWSTENFYFKSTDSFKPQQTGTLFQFSTYLSNSLYLTQLSDSTSDTSKKKNPITDDLDFSWFKQQYRMEKLFIAVGVVSIVIGFPMFLISLVGLLSPQTDKSAVGDAAYYSLIAIGNVLMAGGTALTVVGAVRIHLAKSKNKVEIDVGVE